MRARAALAALVGFVALIGSCQLRAHADSAGMLVVPITVSRHVCFIKN